MHIRYLVTWAALTLCAGSIGAQSAAQHIAEGDSAYAALDPSAALEHYEAALSTDSTNYEALWKASRASVDLGEFEQDKDKRKQYFTEG